MSNPSTSRPVPAKAAIWNDPKYRALFFQAVLLGLVVWAGLAIFENTSANMERQGIATGFNFMSTTAGFGIITHLIDYTESS